MSELDKFEISQAVNALCFCYDRKGLSAPCQEEASRANREKWLKSSVGGSDREVC